MAKAPVNFNYIRIPEPWGGGHTPWDTGLGNRLLHWDVVYAINKSNNYKFFLEVEARYWRELEFIDLPGTRPLNIHTGTNEELQKLLHKYDFDIKNQKVSPLIPLGDSILEQFSVDEEYKLESKNYYTCFDWKFLQLTEKIATDNTGLARIAVKNKVLFNAIRRMGSYCVGIHLRRGAGVFKTPEQLLELPKAVQSNPFLQTLHPTTIYKYWNNNVYESLIREIKQIEPNQKFYVSCDLQVGEYEFLKEKFGDNIKTRQDVIKELPDSIIEGIDFTDIKDERRIALESVIDMMVLSYCDFIIGAQHSTWLDSIQRIRQVPHGFINQSRDILLRHYNKARENSRGVL